MTHRSIVVPRSPFRAPRFSLCIFVAGLIAPLTASAHNPDTSYARFTVAREAISVKLTYDVVTLVRIAPKLDADGDHRLTRDELNRAVPTIADFLRRRIAFEIDSAATDFGELQPVAFPPDHGDAIPEKDYHAATALVSFEFRNPLAAPPDDFWVRFDFFDTVGQRHSVLGAIHHDGSDEEIIFNAFEPDYFFETVYAAEAPKPGESRKDAGSANPAQSRPSLGLFERLLLFFKLGVEHIFEGYDHILFLLSLIVVSPVRQLVKIVTAFTVAHSLTLALAAFRIVELPSQWVEAGIDATIVFTAVENFWIRNTAGRWKLAFVFGLVHGFGFANLLRGLELPTEGFVRALLAFNLGVEAGQLAIVALLAIPAALIARSTHTKLIQRALSAVIALCGAGWLLDRVFNLDWMPF